ncbi:MAG: carboxylesterase family protein [Candidatus Binatia bacterium]|nr:carboxylesterase family protein [Candidatus Binatia bacterium]
MAGLVRSSVRSWTAFILAAMLAACSDTENVGCTTDVVGTTSGDVCGLQLDVVDAPDLGVEGFFAIPFAETTAGDNRWRPPIPKARMDGVFDATDTVPAACPQSDPDSEFGAGRKTSEDCLSLNVWRPLGVHGGDSRPVMIWIYGGSFTSGGTNIPLYDGAYLSATQDVILVTINYRVGALGFLAGVDGLTGNYGLMDQQLAMRWVQDNVAAFGGNPDDVTIFGESAGAMSVGLHQLSVPSSSGLFRAILMESNPFGIPYKTLEQAVPSGELFEKLVGCEDQGLTCLRSVPADTIVEQQSSEALLLNSLVGARLAGFLVFSPLIDEDFLTGDPTITAQNGALDRPTVLGTNTNEGIVFVDEIAKLEGGTISDTVYTTVLTLLFGADIAEEVLVLYPPDPSGDNFLVLSSVATDYLFGCANRFVASQAREAIWVYEFTETGVNIWPDIPQCVDAACHGDDVPFVFHTDRQVGYQFTPEQARLSDEMVHYWGSFGTALDPNAHGGFPWPGFTPAGLEYLVLDSPELSTTVDPYGNCDFWDTIGYDLNAPTEAVNRVMNAALAD